MKDTFTASNISRAGRAALLATIACAGAASLATLGGCASDEPVGHTKTTEKKVIDTPTEKTTITETHEKDTTISPR